VHAFEVFSDGEADRGIGMEENKFAVVTLNQAGAVHILVHTKK